MSLSGITFTTEEGETIELDKNYITENDHKEIIQLRNEEIRERTFRKNIVDKKSNSKDKNGKVIHWSKERIWRENILKKFFKNTTEIEVKNLEHVCIVAMRELKNFDSDELTKKSVEIFSTIDENDDEDTIKQKLINKDTITKGLSVRIRNVYRALGYDGYELSASKKDQEKIIKEHNPLIIRYKNDLKTWQYEIMPDFLKYSNAQLFEVINEYMYNFNGQRKNGIKVSDINIDSTKIRANVLLNKNLELEVIETEDISIPKMEVYKKPVIEKYTKQNNISATIQSTETEKTRITYYIIDKIFQNPKPGTTMLINNDASIEFKF